MRAYRFIFICLLIIAAIASYNIYKIKEDNKIYLNLKQAAQQNETVDFSQVVSGDWDNIIIVNPYADKMEIKNKYGISVNRISDFSVAHRDDRLLIIFCKGKSIQDYIYWFGSVLLGENEKAYDSLQIKREDAKFKTEKNSGSDVFINLIIE